MVRLAPMHRGEFLLENLGDLEISPCRLAKAKPRRTR